MMRFWNSLVRRLLQKSFGFFEMLGIHVVPVHYYSPIPQTRAFKADDKLFRRASELAGIEMNEEKQVALIKRLGAKYSSEYKSIPLEPTGDALLCLGGLSGNGQYSAGHWQQATRVKQQQAGGLLVAFGLLVFGEADIDEPLSSSGEL